MKRNFFYEKLTTELLDHVTGGLDGSSTGGPDALGSAGFDSCICSCSNVADTNAGGVNALGSGGFDACVCSCACGGVEEPIEDLV